MPQPQVASPAPVPRTLDSHRDLNLWSLKAAAAGRAAAATEDAEDDTGEAAAAWSSRCKAYCYSLGVTEDLLSGRKALRPAKYTGGAVHC